MSLRFLCWDCGCEFIIPELFAKGPMERNGGKMPCEWCEGLNTEIIASSTPSGDDDGGETDEGDELNVSLESE